MAPLPRPNLGQDVLKDLLEAQQDFLRDGGAYTLLGVPDCKAMHGCKVYPEGVLWKHGGQENTVKRGTNVLINWRYKEGAAGDAGAMSVARVLEVFTIPSSSSSSKGKHTQDVLCMAIHYYWRWGQVFLGADQSPDTCLSESGAELLLQQDLCGDGTYRVSGPGGRGYDAGVINSIAEVRGVVTVKTYDEVVSYNTLPQQVAQRQAEEARLLRGYAGRCKSWEVAEGSQVRNDYFYYRYLFDDQCFAISYADPAAQQGRVFTEAEMSMCDFFCGLGTVAAAARAANWAVAFGLDRDPVCSSTFVSNIHGSVDKRFNPAPYPHKDADFYKKTIQEFAEELGRGVLQPPPATWAHFSPPCVELSKRKGERFRNLDTAKKDFEALVDVVRHLRSPFVTVEEVDGFLYSEYRQQGARGGNNAMAAAGAAAAAVAGGGDVDGEESGEVEDTAAAAGSGAAAARESCGTPQSGHDSVAPSCSSSPVRRTSAAPGGAPGSSSRSGTPNDTPLRAATGTPCRASVGTGRQADSGAAGSSGGGRARRAATAAATAASLAAAAAGSSGGGAGGSAAKQQRPQKDDQQQQQHDQHTSGQAGPQQQQQQQQQQGSPPQAGRVQKIRPVLLVLAGMLRMGYQVRVTRRCALHDGVPQARWRIVLFAAMRGCQLPRAPPERYCAPLPTGFSGRGKGGQAAGDSDGEEEEEVSEEEEVDAAAGRRTASRPSAAAAAGGPQGAQQRVPGWLHDKSVPTDPDMGYGLVWRDLLAWTPPPGYELLPPCTTVAEAFSDLPPLAPEPQQQRLPEQAAQQEQNLGQATIRYAPEKGQFKIQGDALVDLVESDREDLPVSLYSQYMRSEHYPAQSLTFKSSLLKDHYKYQERADTAAAVAGGGWRLAPHGYAGTLLTHNERRGGVVHPKEDRMLTLLERRRLQSIPDTLELRGGTLRSYERMVGNAVPYLMARAIAEAVYMAAQPGAPHPPNPAPILKGSDPAGTGILHRGEADSHLQPQQQQQQQLTRTYYQPPQYAGREVVLVEQSLVRQVLVAVPNSPGAAAAVAGGGGAAGSSGVAGGHGVGGSGANAAAAASQHMLPAEAAAAAAAVGLGGADRAGRVQGRGVNVTMGHDAGAGRDAAMADPPGTKLSSKRKGLSSSCSRGGDRAAAPPGLQVSGAKRSRKQQQQQIAGALEGQEGHHEPLQPEQQQQEEEQEQPQQQPKRRRQQQQQGQGAPGSPSAPATAAGDGLPPRGPRRRGQQQQQQQTQEHHAACPPPPRPTAAAAAAPAGPAAPSVLRHWLSVPAGPGSPTGAANHGHNSGSISRRSPRGAASPTAVRLPVVMASPHKQLQP